MKYLLQRFDARFNYKMLYVSCTTSTPLTYLSAYFENGIAM